ncbi:MAG: hypothetical protein JWO92_2507 [Chitinophagaceae bacterium]|nr:hypothetical protein [Chitinophagaceae bacterium]
MSHYKSPFTLNQEIFIKDNCKDMYIRDIAKELKEGYTPVYNFIKQNNLKQKKAMKPQVKERRLVKKGKVVDGFFDVDLKSNWAI